MEVSMNRNVLVMLLILAFAFAAFARTGGPDAFGYRFVDSDEPGGPEFEWIDISATGLPGPSGYSGRTTVSLPMNFEWYGTNYNQITICTNGWVCFGSTTSSSSSVDTIPSTSLPQNVMALNFVYLYCNTVSSSIKYQDMGDGTFVVSYMDVYESSYPSNLFSMQVVLDFNRQSVRYNYLKTSTLTSSYRYGYIGIEDNTGSIGLCYGKVTYSATSLHDSLSIIFRPNLVVEPPYFNNCYVSDDFEVGGSTLWELGRPMTGPEMPPSFPYCWCTIKDADYPPATDGYLYMPRMYIHGCGQPIFDWYHWYDIDSASDGGIVEISTNDGITWTQVTPELGYPCPALSPGSALSGQPAYTGTSDGWEYASVDLTPWVIYSEVWLRFRFASNATGSVPGWFIDDVGLTEAYGVIKGTVNLGYRTDESGALVQIQSLDISDVTNSAGQYMLDRVKVGTWNVSCTRDSFAGQVEVGVAIARDETVTVDFYLPPVLLSTNFDTNSAAGVSVPAGAWQWGRPDSMTSPPGEATGPDGTDSLCWGTNLSGNYTNNANWGLEFTVPLLADYPAMTIWHWYKLAGEYVGYIWDGAVVMCKGQYDSEFTIVSPANGYDGPVSDHNPWLGGEMAFGGEDNGSYWHNDKFYLYEWAMDTAIIRFQLSADGAGTNRGWYIDNLVIVDDPSGIGEEYLRPGKLTLNAYPNPFNSAVTIDFGISKPADVDIEIFNIAGKSVRKLIDGDFHSKGDYKITWNGISDDGEKLPSGIYLVNINAGNASASRRIVFLK